MLLGLTLLPGSSICVPVASLSWLISQCVISDEELGRQPGKLIHIHQDEGPFASRNDGHQRACVGTECRWQSSRRSLQEPVSSDLPRCRANGMFINAGASGSLALGSAFIE